MARPAMPTPRGPREGLSADALMRSPSLKPMIASRNGKRPSNARSGLSTPQNMYDYEDGSTIAPTYSSQTLDVSVHSGDTREYRHYPSMNPTVDSAVVPYTYRTYPRHSEGVVYPYDRSRISDNGVRRSKRKRVPLSAPTCYIFLKVLELLSCAAILAVSRIFAWDVHLDYLYTILGSCGLLASGLGLLVVWVRGHPTSNDCVHTTMLFIYCVAAPVMFCGGTMILLLSVLNTTVIILACLFFGGAFLFSVDVMIMTSAILQCYCCCCSCCNPPMPERHQRVYPDTRLAATRLEHHRGSYPPPYPHRHSSSMQYGNGYPGHPTSLPQMSVVR
ncbi:hypothetical protein ACOMHN_016881 [Nucella lapillus]